VGERKREVMLTVLWRSQDEPRQSVPVASGLRGPIDYLCPVCEAVVFASMVDGQVKPGDRAFCPSCRSALQVPEREAADDIDG